MTKSTFTGVRIADAKKVIQDFLETGDFISYKHEADLIKFAKYKLAPDTYAILDDNYADDDSLGDDNGAWVVQLVMPSDQFIQRNIKCCEDDINDFADRISSLHDNFSHSVRRYIRDMSSVDELVDLYKSNFAILAQIHEKSEQFKLIKQIEKL